MGTFIMRLQPPRASFVMDMNDEEREIMGRHAAHWQQLVESGQVVVFGPVHGSAGSWGLGVIETDDEDDLRSHAAQDPVVLTGLGAVEIDTMLAGFVRPAA